MEPRQVSSSEHSSTANHALLLSLSYELAGTLDLREVLARSLAAAGRLVSFRGGSIALVEDGHLAVAVAEPPVSPEVARLRLPVGQGLSGRVAATGQSIYSPDIDADERVDPAVRQAGSNRGIVSYFAVPVVAGGQVVGVLQVDSSERAAFRPQQRGLLASFAPMMGAAIVNARAFEAEARAQVKLGDLQRLRSDFLEIATHELRTPLSLLLGFAELLANHGTDLPEGLKVDDVSERSMRALERLESLVKELQRLALLDAGSLDVTLGPVSLRPVLEEAVASAGGRPIAIEARDLVVIADRGRLLETLTVLLDNAIKFSPADTPVLIEARPDQSEVIIDVIDGGKGVPAKLAEQIFDRFAQAERPSVRSFGGLGLGLSKARAFVERMDGTLEAIPGAEGRFRIRLKEAPA